MIDYKQCEYYDSELTFKEMLDKKIIPLYEPKYKWEFDDFFNITSIEKII